MLVDNVKVALRTMTADEGITGQIQSLIDASIADLKSASIKVEVNESTGDVNPLIQVAVICYVKSYFYSNEDSSNYINSYRDIKAQLALLSEFKEV